MTTYAVVTEIPPATSHGNMATALGQVMIANPNDPTADLEYLDKMLAVEGSLPQTLWWRVAVFSLGEILILDDRGREYAGQGRKPSKWDVSIEHFAKINDAVTRATEVTEWITDREEPSNA